MYSIEESVGGRVGSGGMMQVLGPGDELAWRSLPDASRFWAHPTQLALGHWGGQSQPLLTYLPKQLPEQEFFECIPWGYQVGDRFNQGQFELPSGDTIRWKYRVEPLTRYGASQPEATMGWLSYFPIFEPGWQILLCRGEASGWVDWKGRRYEFVRAPAYAEKNWGCAFPLRWFWMQCNSFEGTPDLSLTAAGAIRKVLGWQQTVGMVVLQWGDRFVKCMPENSRTRWRVEPWGRWEFRAESERYRVTLSGRSDDSPASILVPTADGMTFDCWDTTRGHLQVQVCENRAGSWSLVLEDRSHLAGLEVGGQAWDSAWDVRI